MTNLKKAKILTKYFFVSGYGHFDLYLDEIAHILDILNKRSEKTIKKELSEMYENLQKIRLG